jgi:hypothetical protein
METGMNPFTPRQRFIAALERRPLSGRVPHFELVFYLTIAKRYEHSAIFVQPNPDTFDGCDRVIELIRQKTGERYFMMRHGGRRIHFLDQQLCLYRHAPGIVRVDAGGVEKKRELSVKKLSGDGHIQNHLIFSLFDL